MSSNLKNVAIVVEDQEIETRINESVARGDFATQAEAVAYLLRSGIQIQAALAEGYSANADLDRSIAAELDQL